MELILMCEHGQTKTILVNIPEELSHTQKAHWEAKAIDSCIADIVSALNNGGVLTRTCCCGHGKDGSIILQDGRELIIVKQ